MADLKTELAQFWANVNPRAVAESAAGLLELLTRWGKNVDDVGTPTFRTNLIKWWGKQDESHAKAALKQFDNIIDIADLPSEVKAEVQAALKKLSPGFAVVGTIALIAAGFAANALIKPMLGGFTAKLARHANAVSTPTLPPIDAVLKYFWRSPDPKAMAKYVGYHGFDNEAWNIFDTSSRPILGIPELQILRGLKDWNRDKLATYLHALGYPHHDPAKPASFITNRTLDLLVTPIGLGDLMESERRGLPDEGAYENYLRRHGFDNEQRRIYKGLVQRLPTVGDLQEMERRMMLKSGDCKKWLGKLGYDQGIADNLYKLHEILPDYYLARTLWWRGEYSDDDYRNALWKLGYDEDTAKKIKIVSSLMPTPTDLIRFGVREVFTPAIRRLFRQDEDFPKAIVPWGKKIGLTEDVLKLHWASHWDLPAPGQGFQMLHRGIITYPQLQMLLRALDVMPFWRDRIIQLSYRLIPRRTLPKYVRQGLMDYEAVFLRFQALGFNAADAEIMAKSTIKDAEEVEKQLTKGEVIDAYVYGEIDYQCLAGYLKDLDYVGGELALLLTRAERKRKKRLEIEAKKDVVKEAEKARELTKSEILRGYRDKMITRDRASGLLFGVKYSPVTISYLLTSVDFQRERDLREGKAKQLKRLFDVRAISDTQTVRDLSRCGYTNAAAIQLTTVWTAERQADETIAAMRVKMPSRTDLADWLTKRIIGVDAWRERMEQAGYSDYDITAYLLEIVHDMEK